MKNKRAKHKYLLVIVLCTPLLAGVSEAVFASDCNLTSSPGAIGAAFPSTIAVSANDAPGTVLASQTVAVSHPNLMYCNASGVAPTYVSAYSAGLGQLYPPVVTGMVPYTSWVSYANSGIGVRFYENSSQLTQSWYLDPHDQGGLGRTFNFTGPGYQSYSGNIRIELVLVSTAPSQPITNIPAGAIGIGSNWTKQSNYLFGGPVFNVHNSNPIAIVWSTSTCSIAAGDVNKIVTLQGVKSSDFNSSPSAGDTPFTLTVENCQDTTSATFTFSGTPDSINPVLFKNTGDATGVGVRIYTAGDSQTVGANNTTNVRTVPVVGGQGGQAVLSLGAQYYKTGATVGAGQVSSRITVTTSYN